MEDCYRGLLAGRRQGWYDYKVRLEWCLPPRRV